MGFIRLACSFAIVEIFLLRVKHNPIHLTAWGLMGAHVVGFMGADAFGTLQETAPWVDNVGMSVAALGVTVGAMCVGMWIALVFRSGIARMDNTVDANEIAWENQCLHSEEEFFAFTAGLVITQTCRFAIMGKMPHFHGPQFNNELSQIHEMFFVAMGFAVFTLITAAVEMNTTNASWMVKRTVSIVQETSAMTMGWCLLFWGKWKFWYIMKEEIAEGDVMSAQMYMAVIFSGASFLFIFALDFLSDRMPSLDHCFRALIEAFELLMGLSWESCFMTAVAGATGSEFPNKYARVLASAKICGFLCVLIIPAWLWHILPRGLKPHGEHATSTSKPESSSAASDQQQAPAISD